MIYVFFRKRMFLVKVLLIFCDSIWSNLMRLVRGILFFFNYFRFFKVNRLKLLLKSFRDRKLLGVIVCRFIFKVNKV